MNRITIATSLAFALIGCSQDADIGVDSTPITCADVGGAEVNGRVNGAPAPNDLEFGATQPRVVLGPAGTSAGYTLLLEDGSLRLDLGFQCGPAELASYGVVDATLQVIDCPLQVTGAVLGRIEYLPAKSGTVIVDENANCLAGRFAIDFGDGGELSGWFSSAWQ